VNILANIVLSGSIYFALLLAFRESLVKEIMKILSPAKASSF
jgi:hypothetical protein